jgi:copper(I)-binding protein
VRVPWPSVAAGVLVAGVGAAGLIRGAVPQSVADSGTSAAGPIVVTNAYVRAPVPPTKVAAAYFTVYNTTGTADRLLSVQTGAGSVAVLHTVNPDGSMTVDPSGAVIPAHGTLKLSTGKGHVMIEHLFGKLAPGDRVNIELDFQRAAPVDVVAPVIKVGAPAPGEGK